MVRQLSRVLLADFNVFILASACFLILSAILYSTFGAPTVPRLVLHETRRVPLDLAVAGDLAGLPSGTVRYVTRNGLLRLPQVTFTTDDANFPTPTQVSGVLLEDLVQQLSAHPQADIVVAISRDLYDSNYPQSYIAAHQPVLVLSVNGKSPDSWPRDTEGHGLNMGPYLISHSEFTSSFKILSHRDAPQIPWAVVRLDFLNEQEVLGAIAPRGPRSPDASVQAGYRIAQQNCFRCHNLGAVGGQKAKRPWTVLATWALASPEYFSAYVRNPKSKNQRAQMPANPNYDDPTLQALVAYFRTFAQDNP